jgi:5,10-methylenetetrahydrofolate reductase
MSVASAVAMNTASYARFAYTAAMAPRTECPLVRALRAPAAVVSVELRPPRAELDAAAGMDAWIDTYHAVSGLVRNDVFVFLTDSAVGAREEHNLRHLVINLGTDVRRDHVVPFLTAKHSMDFCLSYAERAWQEGFPSLVVLGGDRTVGPARCVEHAWQLREAIREQVPELSLGGWANPHADAARQASFLEHEQFTAEFFLTQVVSHHDMPIVERFVAELARRRIDLPGLFGVFYYRSANPRTLDTLQRFLPVPAEGLIREFGAGASADEVCARTIRRLREAGVRHVYVSNLPVGRARQTLERVMALV